LPRGSAIMRHVAGRETEAQVLAVNVDIAFLVSSLGPDLEPRRIERYLSVVGMEALGTYLRPGATAVLLGSSGVGKSTIVNRIVGTELLRTQEVREDDGKGRHTTSHR